MNEFDARHAEARRAIEAERDAHDQELLAKAHRLRVPEPEPLCYYCRQPMGENDEPLTKFEVGDPEVDGFRTVCNACIEEICNATGWVLRTAPCMFRCIVSPES